MDISRGKMLWWGSMACLMGLISFGNVMAQDLQINEQEYFEEPGLNVMVFDDYYPEGHQGGVSIIQHGRRVATNGNLRLSATPGQWQPIPKLLDRYVNHEQNKIGVQLMFPDSSRILSGHNAKIYPDLQFDYTVEVQSIDSGFRVEVDLKEPLPEKWEDQVGFNLELFPGYLFGKGYYMDGKPGIFPRQGNGPIRVDPGGEIQATPMATGRRLTIAPEDPELRMTIASGNGNLQLLDGRICHNNGWFVVRSPLQIDKTENAVVWKIYPHTLDDWQSPPVIHVSQVGYHPTQQKKAIIELDNNAEPLKTVRLVNVANAKEKQDTRVIQTKEWGEFLRYRYLTADFTDVREPGIYRIRYGDRESNPFSIDPDIYKRGVWQPTLEYFLPVQMCHMRVQEKYRVWHGRCHMDDALMAPVNIKHIDGYEQGPVTLCDYEPLEHVPGLNVGGWHDAGDYDLRIESQAGTVYMLSLAWEAFDVSYDQTYIDQKNNLVEIHHPDGEPDILQQVEHGVLSILGGYRQLGRVYNGIICPTLRQYVLLGDASVMTDNKVYTDPGRERFIDSLWHTRVADEYSSLYTPMMRKDKIEVEAPALDDRLVFTEDSPRRAMQAAQGLAAASRVLRGYNDTLARECLHTAESIWEAHQDKSANRFAKDRIHACAELLLASDNNRYEDWLVDHQSIVEKHVDDVGWVLGRVMPHIYDQAFQETIDSAIRNYSHQLRKEGEKTPFGVPYEPNIWGAGWGIQEFGVKGFYLHAGWPDYISDQYFLDALNFVLGVHPGSNTASFASGVGSNSLMVAYGVNRADWSFIPGGVGSGTALIRPDFPELKTWPYLWQQTEYVMGGGGSNFMFLALAAEHIFKN